MKDINISIQEIQGMSNTTLKESQPQIYKHETVESHRQWILKAATEKSSEHNSHKIINIFLVRNFGGQKAINQYFYNTARKNKTRQ